MGLAHTRPRHRLLRGANSRRRGSACPTSGANESRILAPRARRAEAARLMAVRPQGIDDLVLPSWAKVTEKRRKHIARVCALLMQWADEIEIPSEEREAWLLVGRL